MTDGEPIFERLALIGVGLIGSSIARAARAAGAVRSIAATAKSGATRRRVAELGLAEAYRRVHNPDEARSILKLARAHHPKSLAVLKALATLEIEAESFDAAIEALRETGAADRSSDVVALLIFEHQMHMMNLLNR